MTVEITMTQVVANSQGLPIRQMQPCWNNFTSQLHLPDYQPSLSSLKKKQMMNKHLTAYNARVCHWSFVKVVAEFDSEEDLVQFVLAWS